MRTSKLFTSVAAALALMYASGCGDNRALVSTAYPCGSIPPAQYAVQPVPVATTAGQPVQLVKLKKSRGKRAKAVAPAGYYAAPSALCQSPANHYCLALDPCLSGYTTNYSGYATVPYTGTANLLTTPAYVPAGPYTLEPPTYVQAPAPAPVVAVTPGAQVVSQVAGTDCRTVYRKGRRPKAPKAPKMVAPAAVQPVAVSAPYYAAPAPTVTYAPEPYVAPAPVPEALPAAPVAAAPAVPAYVPPEPTPIAASEPAVTEAKAVTQPLVIEPRTEPTETAAISQELIIKPTTTPTESSPIVQPVVFQPSTQSTTQQPIIQPVIIQPIIQPLIQAPQQQVMSAAVQAPPPPPAPRYFAPPPPPAQETFATVIPPYMPPTGSGFEPGVLGNYCPPDICPVPNPVLCAPGQNLSDCFTMNEYQILNTPTQIYTPNAMAPLPIAVPPVNVIPNPAAQSVDAQASKYQPLPFPGDGGRIESRPEVMMPTPIVPPVPGTSEIENAVDAMLGQSAPSYLK